MSDYKSIVNLNPKEEEGNGLYYAAFSAVCLRVWLEKQHRPGRSWNNKKRFQLDTMILSHILQLGSNSILTQEKYRDPLSSASYTDISYAMFPTVALFNHSCKRETLLLNINNQMRVFAGRDIKAGEEIYFDYYTAFIKNYTFQDRQKKIYNDIGFYCKCTFCEEEYSPPQIAYLCPNCKGALFINLDDTNQCSKCKAIFDQEKIDWLKDIKAQGLAKAKLAEDMDPDAVAESTLKEAYNLLSQALHPNNAELDQARKSLFEHYVHFSRFNKAIGLAKVTAQAHKEVYGVNSFEYVIAQKDVIVTKFRQFQASKDKNPKLAAEIRAMATDHIEKYENLIKIFKTYKSIIPMEKQLEPLKMVKMALTSEDS
jgi:set and mynd domain containing protein, putative